MGHGRKEYFSKSPQYSRPCHEPSSLHRTHLSSLPLAPVLLTSFQEQPLVFVVGSIVSEIMGKWEVTLVTLWAGFNNNKNYVSASDPSLFPFSVVPPTKLMCCCCPESCVCLFQSLDPTARAQWVPKGFARYPPHKLSSLCHHRRVQRNCRRYHSCPSKIHYRMRETKAASQPWGLEPSSEVICFQRSFGKRELLLQHMAGVLWYKKSLPHFLCPVSHLL